MINIICLVKQISLRETFWSTRTCVAFGCSIYVQVVIMLFSSLQPLGGFFFSL